MARHPAAGLYQVRPLLFLSQQPAVRPENETPTCPRGFPSAHRGSEDFLASSTTTPFSPLSTPTVRATYDLARQRPPDALGWFRSDRAVPLGSFPYE